ncbi:hypothetical protein PHYC_00304 [Phycisphaerales bacterium]|nr:hypothetical protein PHYC_00304 [Phycisphaerales bacterium]
MPSEAAKAPVAFRALRARARRVAKWVGLVVCVALGGLLLCSLRWQAAWFAGTGPAGLTERMVLVGNGAFTYRAQRWQDPSQVSHGVSFGGAAGPLIWGLDWYSFPGFDTEIVIPLWMPFVAVTSYLALYRLRGSPARGFRGWSRRRILKWVTLVVCIGISAAYVALFKRAARGWIPIGGQKPSGYTTALRFDCEGGAIVFSRSLMAMHPGGTVRAGWFIEGTRGIAWWLPRWNEPGAVNEIVMPLWIPLALVGVPMSILWFRDRGVGVRDGMCRCCGYDRAGLDPKGACPECGAPGPGVAKANG